RSAPLAAAGLPRLSLHAALPIFAVAVGGGDHRGEVDAQRQLLVVTGRRAVGYRVVERPLQGEGVAAVTIHLQGEDRFAIGGGGQDRKSTRLNSSHVKISYAVFCL